MIKSPSIFFVLFIIIRSIGFGQIIIAGKITDSFKGEPLIGSGIQMENSDIKTISNEEGDFEIKVIKFPTTLIITHVGYKKLRKLVERNEIIKISLIQKPIELLEVRTRNPAILRLCR